jgi:hypothetical protein
MALLALAVVAGCGARRPFIAIGAKGRPAIRGFVRTDVLIARSPLQDDVRRLTVAEKRLRSLARGGGKSGSPSVFSGYDLPALGGPTAGGDAGRTRAGRTAALEATRRELRSVADGELQAFLEERTRRQSALVDQRRKELQAVDTGQESARIRKAREAKYAEANREIQALTDNILLVQAGIAVLDAQLGTGANRGIVPPVASIFPPVTDVARFRADLAAIHANPKAPNIDMHVRLRAKWQDQQAELTRLLADLTAIKARADTNAGAAEEAIEKQRLADIENQLSQLMANSELRQEVADQYGELEKVLAADTNVTERVSAEKSRIEQASGATARFRWRRCSVRQPRRKIVPAPVQPQTAWRRSARASGSLCAPTSPRPCAMSRGPRIWIFCRLPERPKRRLPVGRI